MAADGSFRLELEYPLPFQQIWLYIDSIFYAGIYANKDLHIELDLRKIKASGKEINFNGDGVRYLGTDGALNMYLNDYLLFRRSEQQALRTRMRQIPRFQNPVAKEVIFAYGSIFDSLKMIQDDYIATHPSPYAWLLENERLSEYYSLISYCYWGHTMENALFDKIKEHKTYLLSNNSTDFYRYLSTYLSTHPGLQPRTQKMQQDQMIDKGILILDSIFSPSRADLMKLQLNNSKDITEQKSALERILPGMHTNWCRTVAKSEYAHSVAKIATVNKALASSGNSITAADFGKPLLQTDFGASLYKLSNVKGADFLARLRQSFSGKAIVFDLWATWCAPCLAEMPHSKQLQQHSKDLPVVFVYVCTSNNSDENKWKSKIGELKLPGIHFYIDETLDAELSQFFSFSGYPGHAFIDRNGVYKPGAIKRVSDIKDSAALAALIN
ncbi:TlpA family protein disulfide reductase [Paraflavitalea soli]|uniref:TlpA family protein disulfide reductase n=1 Tax=Paraflavitalea soli TaxID=2315862 RepID=UPI0013C424C5|nr:TlpA disulfide reductase family protein [Paraflavitalea soli]